MAMRKSKYVYECPLCGGRMGSDIKPSLPFVCEHGKRGSTLGPFLMTFDQESSTVKKEPEYETKVVKSRSQLNWEKKQASE